MITGKCKPLANYCYCVQPRGVRLQRQHDRLDRLLRGERILAGLLGNHSQPRDHRAAVLHRVAEFRGILAVLRRGLQYPQARREIRRPLYQFETISCVVSSRTANLSCVTPRERRASNNVRKSKLVTD